LLRALTVVFVNGVNTQKVVIDGGGLVTLDGGGTHRILYQDTCDSNLGWATASCTNQTFPQITLQNITLANGAGATSSGVFGGGAVYVRGGTFRAYNIRVTGSHETHLASELTSDLAGGAVYLLGLAAPAQFAKTTFTPTVGRWAASGHRWLSRIVFLPATRRLAAGETPRRKEQQASGG
jgi:hypothetical protein